jgi:hypothetical protein
MGYPVSFIGNFEYPDKECLRKALDIIKQENSNPDDDEPNLLEEKDFHIEENGKSLRINFSNVIPASCWYGCTRVIQKMSKNAIKGKIKCSFEGDPDEWVNAGQGWD